MATSAISCSTQNAKMSSQVLTAVPPHCLNLSGNIPEMKRGREYNTPEKLFSFLNLDDTPFSHVVLFFIPGLVVLSLTSVSV
jgi:hypothetical protein